MNRLTDQELLHDYATRQAEATFTELVSRHVDLVYSAALRMVRDTHLAEDVTQGVFVALAQNARQLAERPVLSGWLHRTAQNLAAKVIRTEVRRRNREQAAAFMNELSSQEPENIWHGIAPQLDAALGELTETERDPLLLRYFEHKSAQEIGRILGISEDAAQKRVSRAMETLRTYFARQGIAVGASGLLLAVTTRSVQAAPAGLAAAVSSGALGGKTLLAATTATKAMTMTTLKTILAAGLLAVAIGTGIFEGRQVSILQKQVQSLEQTPAPVQPPPDQSAVQIQQLIRERDEAQNQLTVYQQEDLQLKSNNIELLALRSKVGELTGELRIKNLAAGRRYINLPHQLGQAGILDKIILLKARLLVMPRLNIPEIQYMDDAAWVAVAQVPAILDSGLQTENEIREALAWVRQAAKSSFAQAIGRAVAAYAEANNGQLPADILQLKPYFNPIVDDALLQRYQMIKAGTVNDVSGALAVVIEKAPVDDQYDFLFKIGLNSYTDRGIGREHSGTGSGSWGETSQTSTR